MHSSVVGVNQITEVIAAIAINNESRWKAWQEPPVDKVRFAKWVIPAFGRPKRGFHSVKEGTFVLRASQSHSLSFTILLCILSGFVFCMIAMQRKGRTIPRLADALLH